MKTSQASKKNHDRRSIYSFIFGLEALKMLSATNYKAFIVFFIFSRELWKMLNITQS